LSDVLKNGTKNRGVFILVALSGFHRHKQTNKASHLVDNIL